MIVRISTGNRPKLLLASLLLGCGVMNAADDLAAVAVAAPVKEKTAETAAGSATDEISRLKLQLAAQQKQLEVSQESIQAQQKMLERALTALSPSVAPARLGEVASIAPMIPTAPSAALPSMPASTQRQPGNAAQGDPSSGNGNPCEAGVDANAVPPYLRVGNTCIQPIGFMDFTTVWRDKTSNESIGSNFGGIPPSNAVPGAKLSEFRFSPQNSRLGFRADSNYKGSHVTGYLEFDFLASPAATNFTVTNGAVVPRLRLFWLDVRKDKWEILGGQSWSMLTPNRKGISALPGDLFYSQVIDVNYMIGLPWTRQPGFRVLYHPTEKVTAGVSFEQPEMYAGGSAGSSVITAPTAFAGLIGTQLNNQTTNFNTPTPAPDVIGKVAFDPNSHVHFEIAGAIRTFRIINPTTLQTSSKEGGGFSVNGNFELVKNFRFVTNNFYGPGGGRYIFGQAPDVIINNDGSLKTILSRATVDGFEWTINKTLLYTYYGALFVDKTITTDSTGKQYGYGASGAAQNRNIQEFTIGFNQTLYKNARYGAVNFMGQYEYLNRNLWYVAPGTAKGAHDTTVYLNLRYTLPGDMPKF